MPYNDANCQKTMHTFLLKTVKGSSQSKHSFADSFGFHNGIRPLLDRSRDFFCCKAGSWFFSMVKEFSLALSLKFDGKLQFAAAP